MEALIPAYSEEHWKASQHRIENNMEERAGMGHHIATC